MSLEGGVEVICEHKGILSRMYVVSLIGKKEIYFLTEF